MRLAYTVLKLGDIEAKLTSVTRIKFCSLQLNDHISELADLEKQQVGEGVISVDIKTNLATHRRKPRSELAESVNDALDEPMLQDPFGSFPSMARNSRANGSLLIC